ncbi:ATP-binding protein [Tardiphaga sp. 20_F10_N6_6]|uniref:ATP-binding protein n=1 Tax=Tardiphaga sp. 20_F10_N6_6 TaxID=3240788 RepID=UPI003F8ABD97
MSGVSTNRGQLEDREKSGATPDEVISFGPFRLYSRRRLLERAGEPLLLSSRALDILIVLVEEPGKVVTKTELVSRVWSNMAIDEANIRVQMAALRRALGQGELEARYITTVPGQGYCFVAPVSRLNSVGSSEDAPILHPNLPPPLTRMVGREQTVLDIAARIKFERFVSIVGPGGIGKTTIAVSVGHELHDEFAGVVFFFDLGLLNEPLLVPGAVALTLGISPQSADLTASLISHLRGKRALLIIDSCEHVIESVATLAERIFVEAPHVHILTTSRESLRVEGEKIDLILPLASPPQDAELTAMEALRYPAVQLFVERAIANGDILELSDAEAPLVGEICRRLDGIPLAIQLAAGRARAYGIEGTLLLLTDLFDLIWEGSRTAVPRHQTLRATLDWSYNLLSVHERSVLRGLSVFVGTFTVDAACAVSGNEYDEADVFMAVAGLVGKSLVEVDAADTTTRYRLLDTTRAHGALKLREFGELDIVMRRHANYYHNIFALSDMDSLASSKDIGRRSELLGNARVALEWSLSSRDDIAIGISLAVLVTPFLSELSLLAECHRLAERALAAIGPKERGTRQEMELQGALGSSLMLTGGYRTEARLALSRALQLAQELNDPYWQMRLLRGLHNFYIGTGDFGKSIELASRNEVIARGVGDPAPIAMADWMLGLSHYFVGDHLSAEKRCEALLEKPATLRAKSRYFGFDSYMETRIQCALAATRWFRGFPDQAMEIAQETIKGQMDEEHPVTFSTALVFAGFMFVRIGDVPKARGVIERLIAHDDEHSLGPHRAVGIGLKGALDIHHGNIEHGVQLMLSALDALQADRYELHHPAFLGSLAEGFAKIGQGGSALDAVENAIARVEANGQKFVLPELLRIHGTILMLPQHSNLSQAEKLFEKSLELSGLQHALAWELRTAKSFAEMRLIQGHPEEASELLAPVFARFTEGFESADLTTARSLLDRLARG